MDEPILQVRDVSLTYSSKSGTIHALDSLSFMKREFEDLAGWHMEKDYWREY